jgi:hypothetical protein
LVNGWFKFQTLMHWKQQQLRVGYPMKIESGRGVSSTGGAKKAAGAAAPGFAPSGVDAPQKATAASGPSAVTPLDAILALQADETPSQRRARQARRGHEALDTLERLATGLLVGRAPGSLRAELETLRRAGEPTGEPGLDDALREIDTRLAVEAAKLERLQGRA